MTMEVSFKNDKGMRRRMTELISGTNVRFKYIREEADNIIYELVGPNHEEIIDVVYSKYQEASEE